jgi:adenosylhomocysteine nucleosidase
MAAMSLTLILTAVTAEASSLVRRLDLKPDRAAGRYLTWRGSHAGDDVALVVTGMGRQRAIEVVRDVLKRWPVTRILVGGLAGAVNPELKVGDVIVPRVVADADSGARFSPNDEPTTGHALRTGDEVVGNLAGKAQFFDLEFDAVDMETAAIARLAEQHAIPWLCVRGISDAAGDTLPAYLAGFTDELGRARPVAVALHLLGHPWHIPALMRIGRNAGLAADRAAERIVELLGKK